jgi:hypothetical protein
VHDRRENKEEEISRFFCLYMIEGGLRQIGTVTRSFIHAQYVYRTAVVYQTRKRFLSLLYTSNNQPK